MKLYSSVRAYKSICEILSFRLPYLKTREIMRLKIKLKDEMEYYSLEEEKLIKIYGKKDSEGNPLIENGKITFETEEMMNEYISQISRLREMDVEINFKKIELSDEEMKNQQISGVEIDNLKDFIEFLDSEA